VGGAFLHEIIYIDVLVAINVFVTYLLLATSVLLSAVQTKRWRLLVASLLGGAASLLIFLPPVHWILLALMRIVLSALIVFVAFGFESWRRALRCYAAFFGMNFALAGIMLALWMVVQPAGMFFQNGAVYFDVSLITFVLFACVSYAIIRGTVMLLRRRHPGNCACEAVIQVGEHTVTLPAFYDSGNKLCDGFTGAPVIVVAFAALRDFLPEGLHEFYQNKQSLIDVAPDHPWRTRVREIPFHAMGHSGLLPAFRSDRVTARAGGKTQKTQNAIVAVTTDSISDGAYHVILQSSMLER